MRRRVRSRHAFDVRWALSRRTRPNPDRCRIACIRRTARRRRSWFRWIRPARSRCARSTARRLHKGGVAVTGAVGDLERLVLVAIRNDRQDRAETSFPAIVIPGEPSVRAVGFAKRSFAMSGGGRRCLPRPRADACLGQGEEHPCPDAGGLDGDLVDRPVSRGDEPARPDGLEPGQRRSPAFADVEASERARVSFRAGGSGPAPPERGARGRWAMGEPISTRIASATSSRQRSQGSTMRPNRAVRTGRERPRMRGTPSWQRRGRRRIQHGVRAACPFGPSSIAASLVSPRPPAEA